MHNISLAQIQSQIDALNKDFRRLNADRVNTPAAFLPVASDFNIEFRLACTDSVGNATNGVVRKFTSKQNGFIPESDPNDPTLTDEVATGIKVAGTGDAAWPTDKYLNIWLCNLRYKKGYGTFPADYIKYPRFDGIAMNTGAFNSTGRTLTHEAGHWLNLHHTWGDIDNTPICETDFVDDTPAQKYPTQTGNGSCASYPRLDICNPNDPSSMFMNYMDYSEDPCMNLFTNGQKLRARAVFATGGPRAGQINGFFGFSGVQAPIVCTGRVTVSGMCVAATWTLVSGPATITAGQGTNQITLQATGNGVVVLRATAGNYTSGDVSVNVFALGPDAFPFTSANTNVSASGSTLFVTYPPSISVSAFRWIKDGVFYRQTTAPQLTTTLVNQCHDWSVSFVTSCGASPETLPVTVGCGGALRSTNYLVYANPVNDGVLNVQLSESGDGKERKINILDNSLSLRKALKTRNKIERINVSTLPNGNYYLVIEEGVNKETIQVLIQKN